MVALEARQRVLGLPENLAGHEKAETVLGRLWLTKQISEAMRQGGERYHEIYLAAMRALKAPIGLAVSGQGGTGGEEITEDYVVWATKAVARYRAIKIALENLDGEGSVAAIVNRVVIENTEPPEAWLPPLRRGLALLSAKLGAGGEG